MPSFAKAGNQAAKAVSRSNAIGTSRHGSQDRAIHSLGTARSYEHALTRVAEWDHAHGGTGLLDMTDDRAQAYLAERAEQVAQPTIDQERQALEQLPQVSGLERVHSAIERGGLAHESRAYTYSQIQAIASAQTERHALATEIAADAGLRAHELYTLRPASERTASDHREWRDDRHTGRSDVAIYTVEGKGGLVREVGISRDLADRLEDRRYEQAREVSDRGIRYESHYDIGGGVSWSASFSRASDRELGYSTGAHGVRHEYAQERVETLQAAGYSYDDALGVVAEEMGHFRSDITETYLR